MRPALALTAFYFSSFAALGIFLPYFNLYLLHRGLAAWQIGLIAAVPPLLKILVPADRKSTRLNSSHSQISYAVFCLKKKNISNKRGAHSFVYDACFSSHYIYARY